MSPNSMCADFDRKERGQVSTINKVKLLQYFLLRFLHCGIAINLDSESPSCLADGGSFHSMIITAMSNVEI
jgi:hypothetical protein